MCLECEKTIFVKCIKSIDMEELEVFTEGKTYGVFSWYCSNEDCYNLTAMDNTDEEYIIAEAVEDDISKFTKDEWFMEHFELVS